MVRILVLQAYSKSFFCIPPVLVVVRHWGMWSFAYKGRAHLFPSSAFNLISFVIHRLRSVEQLNKLPALMEPRGQILCLSSINAPLACGVFDFWSDIYTNQLVFMRTAYPASPHWFNHHNNIGKSPYNGWILRNFLCFLRVSFGISLDASAEEPWNSTVMSSDVCRHGRDRL